MKIAFMQQLREGRKPVRILSPLPHLPHQHTLALQLQVLDAQFVEGHFDADSTDSNKLVNNSLGLCDLTHHSCVAAMSAQGHKAGPVC